MEKSWTPPDERLFFPRSPLLRRVGLFGIHSPWVRQMRAWPMLTTLGITQRFEGLESHRLSLSDLLELFTTLSQLQYLALRNVVGTLRSLDSHFESDVVRLSIDPDALLTTQPLEVPNLRYLAIDTPDN